ncbi:RNA-binding cell elongation regulator Jag/EloR [Novisyntrophococcus fermenticellae]|uniref:RNA-binding cell elongation regulator Jag/EloR n=1 Tax=Novisyntrophococcus fermenticellae TaxID=2068655 RepID=UPI001E343B45|nr:RNA-binding cell elongation regulator Jag/EloR [Novisyntrophococcus fermenticellae]
MEFVEVSAKTVNEAITKACIELGVSSDRLEIQVVSEGSSGFLGFGAKPAVIKARKKEEPVNDSVVKHKTENPVEKKEAVKKEVVSENKVEPLTAKEEQKEEHIKVDKSEEEIVVMKASAQKFLDSVFHAMNLEVDINMVYHAGNDSLDIDFSGEDMGILIGKRGQTLDSLQYLTSLVVNKDQKEYVRVKLDTENYRKRRKETLENLAKNIAYKVRKTRKPVSLEPMNPYERRIIHSALQGNKWVETYSEGKEPYRHVVITAKNN